MKSPEAAFSHAIHELTIRFKKRALQIDEGRNRRVFVFSKYVIKIPITYNGITDNDWEGSISNTNDDPDEIRYPRTRLTYWEALPIVLMERVTLVTTAAIKARLGSCPDWVNSVDGGQVGFTRDGRLVAFDYGLT